MTRSAYAPVVALAVAAGVLGWAGLGGPGPSGAISGSFERVLARMTPAEGPLARAADTGAQSDLLKLSSAPGPAEMPFGLGRPVSVGDKITIAGTDGVKRVLEVTDVQRVPGLSPVSDSAPAMLLVTCVARDPAGTSTVRFVIESAAPAAQSGPALHQAL